MGRAQPGKAVKPPHEDSWPSAPCGHRATAPLHWTANPECAMGVTTYVLPRARCFGHRRGLLAALLIIGRPKGLGRPSSEPTRPMPRTMMAPPHREQAHTHLLHWIALFRLDLFIWHTTGTHHTSVSQITL